VSPETGGVGTVSERVSGKSMASALQCLRQRDTRFYKAFNKNEIKLYF
jgi:hypothetical protein